jgi:hypothetical protein
MKTEIELPEDLYRELERLARDEGLNIGQVVRLGVEQLVGDRRGIRVGSVTAVPPPARHLGPFLRPVEDWRLLSNDPVDGEP